MRAALPTIHLRYHVKAVAEAKRVLAEAKRVLAEAKRVLMEEVYRKQRRVLGSGKDSTS